MSLLVVGMNHNSADEIVRERIVFDAGMLPDAYSDILDHPDITEAVIPRHATVARYIWT